MSETGAAAAKAQKSVTTYIQSIESHESFSAARKALLDYACRETFVATTYKEGWPDVAAGRRDVLDRATKLDALFGSPSAKLLDCFVVERNGVVAHVELNTNVKSSGAPLCTQFIHVFDFDNEGLLTHEEICGDFTGMLVAAGIPYVPIPHVSPRSLVFQATWPSPKGLKGFTGLLAFAGTWTSLEKLRAAYSSEELTSRYAPDYHVTMSVTNSSKAVISGGLKLEDVVKAFTPVHTILRDPRVAFVDGTLRFSADHRKLVVAHEYDAISSKSGLPVRLRSRSLMYLTEDELLHHEHLVADSAIFMK